MPDARPLRPGDPARLGAYEVLGRLGEGGQGAVLLGRAAGGAPDGDYVAIKLLHADLTADSPARARFARELEVAKRIARFCTAQVLDAEVEGDRPYIVSEYVPGPSLHAAVEEQGPRSGGALERLAVSTLTALAAIHQAGIMHRDFKPHNIMLAPDGPRVIDFGIARTLNATSETQNIGTPAYMAPEQFTGHGFGPPADLFAWGTTMVFAATGSPAFGNDDTAAVMHRIIYEDPELGRLPSPLREVVASCLTKDPERRPTAQMAQQRLMGSGHLAAAASDRDFASPRSWSVPAGAFADAPAPVTGPEASRVPPPMYQAPDPSGGAPGGSSGGPPPGPPEVPPTGPPGAAPAGPSEGIPAAFHASGGPSAGPSTDPHRTRPGPRSGGHARTAVLAAGAAVLVTLTAAGAVWAATPGGDGRPEGAGPAEAGTPARTRPSTSSAATSTGGARAPGTTRDSPMGRATTPQAAGRDDPRPGRPRTPGQPAPRPGAPGGGTGSAANPYHPQQVCDSGGHGRGYYVQRSSPFSGGRVYQLYNGSGYNCVVTMKSAGLGKKTGVWAQIERKDGTKATDRGSYAYYAGPVFVYAKGQCVRYAGGAGQGSADGPWGNCG